MIEALPFAGLMVVLLLGGDVVLAQMLTLPVVGDTARWIIDLSPLPLAGGWFGNLYRGMIAVANGCFWLCIALYGPRVLIEGARRSYKAARRFAG